MGRPLQFGEPAPWFEVRSPMNPRFHFDTVAGRHVVLCFFGSAANPASQRILEDILRNKSRFDDATVAFFGVSIDPEDEQCSRICEHLPGIHLFWDFDKQISRLYGAIPDDAGGQSGLPGYRPYTLVLDERLRVFASLQINADPTQHVEQLLQVLSTLPPPEPPSLASVQAPVLVVPRIFEPQLCRALIGHYERHGGQESGFMREIDGKTVEIQDHGHKRRRDQEITDEELRKACMFHIHDRLVPEIQKAFQFRATRIERYIVACYESSTGGHFRAHRDNTTKGTAHRRFAVSVNLNTGEFEGGDLRFPEFGRQTYRPPAGGAVVFSCSLLHEATPVTSGRRYAFLPFLYDDAAARIREQNRQYLDVGESASGEANPA